MRRIKVTHFLQDPAYCAVASSAVVANFYNSEINYNDTKTLAHKKISKEVGWIGLDSGEICVLLNLLGFRKVTLVSSSLGIFDYSWEKYSKNKLLGTLYESIKKKKEKIDRDLSKNILKWYSQEEYNNIIKIDYDFKKYIKKYLNKKKPVIVSFNWTMYFRFIKDGEYSGDAINGEDQEHAVVLNGYDDKGVWIVDSHHKSYKYKRKKYRRGFYKMKWEHLLTCMGQGDVIFPEDYINE